MSEVDVNGVVYNVGRLSCFQQWDLARKLAPFLTALGPALRLAGAQQSGDGGDVVVSLTTALQPLAAALSQMSQRDSNFIMNLCLEVVRRRDPQGNFASVRLPGSLEEAGVLRFESEMDFTVLLRLAWEVITANLGPFLQKGLEASIGSPNGAMDPTMASFGSATTSTGS